MSPQQESISWLPEHWAGSLSTEEQEFLESKVI